MPQPITGSIITDTGDLFTQLFPYPIAQGTEEVGDAHLALGNITVPAYSGEDIYAVYRNLQRRLKGVIDFAYSPKRKGYENAIPNAQDDIVSLSRAIKHYEMALMGYPGLLDLSFLQWPKGRTRYPAFMVMNLDNPRFSIKVTVDNQSWSKKESVLSLTPDFPPEISSQFQVFKEFLEGKVNGEKGYCTISALFSGSPPPETDLKIDLAVATRKFRLVIIGEVPFWKVDTVVEVKKDPIVAGLTPITHPVDGSVIGYHAAYIDIFNPTPLEQLAFKTCLKSLP